MITVICTPTGYSEQGYGGKRVAEPTTPTGKPVGGDNWAAPAASTDPPSEGGRPSEERFQARSRLDQAMTVAQKRIEAGKQVASTPRSDRSSESDFVSDWGSARAETPPSRAPATDHSELKPHVVVDLRPDADRIPGPMPAIRDTDYGLGRRWGAEWQRSAQGWVTGPDGRATWRPVVSTTQELGNWDVHTYLGVVTAEVAVEAPGGDLRQVGATLAKGRQVGIEGLVDEAVERGAHAIIGVTMQYTPTGSRMLITLSGTAVTLQEKAR